MLPTHPEDCSSAGSDVVRLEFDSLVMSTLLHGRPLIPNGITAANLRQQLRAPQRSCKSRSLICIRSQTASTTQKQQPASEKARQKPTASLDTTHVPIKTDEPTDPAHVTNGSGSQGADMEVDSVLAKELSENGDFHRQCNHYGDQLAFV